ncbi:uncharacterized protein BT62DRAFT_531077 [Guyanagaster necrorhizus]|uniref:Homeobox domain-containing protein n=1 Tax=Guyanagaster necrorhizus TaxID=856835 RepID=A0A9P8AY97_9AGAR|nr:uncharacterized protein BT62DRAFT_531077 [Guyanagaster necrorhizus MCA 3950]KAG7450697.1 hypothetical protein BT62DRAFT_531077 [Guyanagaster necrorhizus MCA 3950]
MSLCPGLDTLLMAARYLGQLNDSPTSAPAYDRSGDFTSYAKNSGNVLQVVRPYDGSPEYTSIPVSEAPSQLTGGFRNRRHPSETPPSTLSPPSSPCLSSIDSDYTMSFQSTSSRECSPAIYRNTIKFPKKAAHKSPKVAIVGGKTFKIPITKKDTAEWRTSVCLIANNIKTVPNSPVSERARKLLEKVYDDITTHPPDFWTRIIAARLGDRTPSQVNIWFSNRRQWYKQGTTIQCPLLDGDWTTSRRRTVRLRPAALKMSQKWSDSFFDDVLALYLDEKLHDSLQAECEEKRETIPRYIGKSKKRQIK